tara:strand:+ start:730 stop:903 length:174 start_codon:yes stop_codon:yes gene_type:complete
MFAICVGMIGIQPREFWDMSPLEVYSAIAGFKEFHVSEQDAPMSQDRLKELMELYPD